jgi:hypothetical protein
MLISRRSVLLAAALIPASAGLAYAAGTEEQVAAVSDDDLSRDAAAAWRFFEQGGNVKPGVTPATAWVDRGKVGQYAVLTMWDMGSLINGYVAARSLGIIDDARFGELVEGALVFLKGATFKYHGRALLNFRTSASDASQVEQGFDSTDTGRLSYRLRYWTGIREVRCISRD